MCVCLDDRLYGEREKERRRNENVRGGEAMLTLSCCQTQGVESEEGLMKKEREGAMWCSLPSVGCCCFFLISDSLFSCVLLSTLILLWMNGRECFFKQGSSE